MHHIIPSLVHALGLHAFGVATPPSLRVLGELGVLGVADVVVLAAFDVDDCGYICSMCHMICMQHMEAKSSQQHIVAHRISCNHRFCTLDCMCSCIHLAPSHIWGIAVLLPVCPSGALHSRSLLLPFQQIDPRRVLCPCM